MAEVITQIQEARIVHLETCDCGFAACGRLAGKNRTRNAANVTCEACRETWDFAAAERRAGTRKAAAGG